MNTERAIIKRLLNGWVPNHAHGELIPEWWHPHRFGDTEDMSAEEFAIVSEIETEIFLERLGND